MALLLTALFRMYNYAMTELPDPRVQHLLFMNNVCWPLGIVGAYVLFALSWGPEWMKHRKPYRVERLMDLYNAVQVVYCVYIVFMGIKLVLFKYDWRCAPVDYSMNPEAVQVAILSWSYFIIKIVDLIDTVFFILRKKEQHVSFLHVYHHGGMVAISWCTVKFLPGGHVVYVGIINCFVHAVMYSYYLVSTHYKSNLWFKKHITQLQLAQFATFTLLYGQLFFRKNCDFPWITQCVFMPQNLFMTVLFADFYYKTYIRQKKPIDKKQNGGGANGVQDASTQNGGDANNKMASINKDISNISKDIHVTE